MKYDLVSLLTKILKDAGVSDLIDDDLSNHSTISLVMKDDIPAINIVSESDEVWIYSTICDFNMGNLTYKSGGIFEVLFNYNEDVFYCGQPCLYPIDGDLELRAQVKDKNLESPEAFLKLLEQFLMVLENYRIVMI